MNCSATAQRGALDWKPKFKKATLPVFKELYKRVKNGTECKRVLSSTGQKGYQEKLQAELAVIHNSEMWRAGAASRGLRPKTPANKCIVSSVGTKGRESN